jgi:hypothetical protein
MQWVLWETDRKFNRRQIKLFNMFCAWAVHNWTFKKSLCLWLLFRSSGKNHDDLDNEVWPHHYQCHTILNAEYPFTVKNGKGEIHGTTKWNSQFTGFWSESKFSRYGVKISFHDVLGWNWFSLCYKVKFTTTGKSKLRCTVTFAEHILLPMMFFWCCLGHCKQMMGWKFENRWLWESILEFAAQWGHLLKNDLRQVR